MNRRHFLKNSAALGFYPLLAGGLPVRSMAATSPLYLNPCEVTDRSMVIIFLNGGNDIINTTVPLNQMSEYANFRPDIRLPENSLITLDQNLPDAQQIGLHPALSGFKDLYDDGMLSVVQRVGYAQPNKSHFKSLDNWLTGSGGNLSNVPTGWVGRFFQDRYPGYTGNPFLGEPDPLGILFGNMNSTGFHTFEEHNYEINLSGQDPAGFYTLISSLGGAPLTDFPNTEHGEMLQHIMSIDSSVNVYAQRISETFGNGTNAVSYPNNNLGDQLKTIARMLNGGSRTKIFMATTGGFDTHGGEVDPLDTTQGRHAGLLGGIGSAMTAFQDDLAGLGLDNKVVTVIFSEFGRKIIQNGSYGTDHGTLSSMFVIGKGVEAGVHGDNIDLNIQDNPGAPNASQLQNDYRTVFASLLQEWLGASDNSLNSTFLSPGLINNRPNLINPSNLVPPECYYTPQVPTVCACLQVRVFLEGYYDGSQEMSTQLALNGLLPANQPYNQPPFNYAGDEALTNLPEGTVDWLLVQLRDEEDFSQVIAQKAVLLRKDGFVMELDGTPGVNFEGVPDDYYRIAVLHRSHLAVMSNEAILTNAPNFVYDFTTGLSRAAGVQQQKLVGNAWTMIAGDLDNNHIINSSDFDLIKNANGQPTAYQAADLNADGQVNQTDDLLWKNNRSKIGELK